LLSVLESYSDGNRYRVDSRLDTLRADYVTGLKSVRLDNLVNRVRFNRLSHVICAILSLSLPHTPIDPSVPSFSHLVLRHLRSLFSSPLAFTTMLIEVLKHDIFVANNAGFSARPTSFEMFGIFYLGPNIFTKFTYDWFSRAYFLMFNKELWHNHLIAKCTLFFVVKLFLI
jgi:hypothetical protein